MMRYIVSFILFITGTNLVFADNIATEKSTQSAVAITVSVIVLCCIFYMLVGKQKRRFND